MYKRQELRVGSESYWERISGRCPVLQSLRIGVHVLSGPGNILRPLEARRDHVEAGTLVDGGRMEPLKKHILEDDNYTQRTRERFKELAERVVDRESEPEFWEVQTYSEIK